MTLRTILLGALALGVASPAAAATLTFDAYGYGAVGSTVAVLPEATVTSFAQDLFFGGPGAEPTGLCAYDFGTCGGDLGIDFTQTVTALSFLVGDLFDGDIVEVFAYDPDDLLLGSVVVDGNALTDPFATVDLASLGEIGRIVLDDGSVGGGPIFLDFAFEVAAVPLPAAMPFLLGALGALALAQGGRRRGVGRA